MYSNFVNKCPHFIFTIPVWQSKAYDLHYTIPYRHTNAGFHEVEGTRFGIESQRWYLFIYYHAHKGIH